MPSLDGAFGDLIRKSPYRFVARRSGEAAVHCPFLNLDDQYSEYFLHLKKIHTKLYIWSSCANSKAAPRTHLGFCRNDSNIRREGRKSKRSSKFPIFRPVVTTAAADAEGGRLSKKGARKRGSRISSDLKSGDKKWMKSCCGGKGEETERRKKDVRST